MLWLLFLFLSTSLAVAQPATEVAQPTAQSLMEACGAGEGAACRTLGLRQVRSAIEACDAGSEAGCVILEQTWLQNPVPDAATRAMRLATLACGEGSDQGCELASEFGEQDESGRLQPTQILMTGNNKGFSVQALGDRQAIEVPCPDESCKSPSSWDIPELLSTLEAMAGVHPDATSITFLLPETMPLSVVESTIQQLLSHDDLPPVLLVPRKPVEAGASK
jgi:hypothetical protein